MARAGTELWISGAELNQRGVTTGTEIDEVSTTPAVVEQTIRLSRKCGLSAIAATETQVWFAELCDNPEPIASELEGRHRLREVERALTRYRLPQQSRDLARHRRRRDGLVWFLRRERDQGRTRPHRPEGDFREIPRPKADSYEIAVGPEGRLWFTEEVDHYPHAALNSIGPEGDLGHRTCLAADCKLEPFGLAFDPSGSLWFSALNSEFPNGGGGVAVLILAEERLNQAGFIGHLAMP